MNQWVENKLTYDAECSHLMIYAESFLYEPAIADDIRPLDDYYFPSDYLSSEAPTVLSQYNKEFKRISVTSIDTKL